MEKIRYCLYSFTRSHKTTIEIRTIRMIALYARDAYFISTQNQLSKVDGTTNRDEMYIQTTQVVVNARLYPFTFI